MNEYVLSCCSTTDLTTEQLKKRELSYICFHYTMNEVEYSDDVWQSITADEFYKKLTDGADCHTSQVGVGEYLEYFSKILESGKDLLHVTLSSGISGSYNSACSAALIARERFPERKLYIVDSLAASSGYGLLMDKLADLRDCGMSIDELNDWVLNNRLNLHHWFFSTDLTFYIKGGRVSKAAGIFGGMLGICPLLNVSDEGKLIARAKIRTKKKVIAESVERMVKHAENGTDYSGKCYICNSDCYDDAKAVADLIEAKFPKLDGKVQIYSIGTTIGCHTGPGTVAVFFWGDERVD